MNVFRSCTPRAPAVAAVVACEQVSKPSGKLDPPVNEVKVMLHGTSHNHPSTHSGPRRIPQCRCSSRHTYATHRASSRAQSRSHKRLWQAERQRQCERSGCRNKLAKSLCYSVAAAGSAGSNRDGSGANVQVCLRLSLDAIPLRQKAAITKPVRCRNLTGDVFC